jgi:hypothetical protein
MLLFVSKSKVGSIIRLESFVRRNGKKQNVELATTKKKNFISLKRSSYKGLLVFKIEGEKCKVVYRVALSIKMVFLVIRINLD